MVNKKKGNILLRFVGNRNTVTILGILACIVTLIVGYNVRVDNEINPEVVPYAKETIESRTLITTEMVGKLKISGDYLTTATNVVKTVDDVVNMYATYKSNIPKGSLFYREMLKTADEMPNAAFANIPDGYTIFSLEVSNDSTYGGDINANQYIDLYLRVTAPQESSDGSENNSKILFAKLVESIRVLAVKDKQGNNIIDGVGGTPAELLFAVPEDTFLLLSRASNLSLDIEIIPVIRNHNYTLQAGEMNVPLSELKKFINDRVTEL